MFADGAVRAPGGQGKSPDSTIDKELHMSHHTHPRPPRTRGLPDPYTQTTAHLAARERQFRDAHRELAEAWVFTSARMVRSEWPTAHCIVFDRTETNRDPRSSMEFLRVEDSDGITLTTSDSLPTFEGEGDQVMLALYHHLVAAERYLNVAGLVGPGRAWNIVNECNFDSAADPSHLCRITLPPAVRPHHTPAALPRTSASLRRPSDLDAGDFLVVWTSELSAEDPMDAAEQAQRMLLEPDSLPPVFEVTGTDGSTFEVDLSDHTTHAVNTSGVTDHENRPAPRFLADYPHPLPSSVDPARACLMPVEMLLKGDVILGVMTTVEGHMDFTPCIPRYADPAPACGVCSPECTIIVFATAHHGRAAMHTTAIGQEVTDAEETDGGDLWYFTASADEIYVVIPGKR